MEPFGGTDGVEAEDELGFDSEETTTVGVAATGTQDERASGLLVSSEVGPFGFCISSLTMEAA